MIQLNPEPPPEHYIQLGRVMSACSMLELKIGMIGWAAKNGKRWTEQWDEVAGQNGGAKNLVKSQLPHMDDSLAAEVKALMAEAEPVLQERHKYAHAVFILDPTQPAEDQWILRSPRMIESRPLTEHEGNKLVATANRLSKRATVLGDRAADQP
ncbi:hypothetical protein CH304_03635 [Rhodococcus sp. 15-649-1-2]|nr:hypothetical protein [Rhodococcus sp. 15-649-1-2]OZE85996.1 hypothetical protein CH304_03635 [Rhodococcus sp. 15-649-1-2]